MNDVDALSELMRIKEEIGTRYATARDLAAAVNRLAKTDPLPPAGKSRKMIEGFPKGQSVADEDETMKELHAAKESIAAENDYDLHKIVEAARAFSREHPPQSPGKSRKLLGKSLRAKKRDPNAPLFRSTSSKSASKQRGNGKH